VDKQCPSCGGNCGRPGGVCGYADIEDDYINQDKFYEFEFGRFSNWVKEDRIPLGRRGAHWKTWCRALMPVEQDASDPKHLIEMQNVMIANLKERLDNLHTLTAAERGMADCMRMVHQELIEAGIVDARIAPMFIADAVMRKFAELKGDA
jgi:hypothetical protein